MSKTFKGNLVSSWYADFSIFNEVFVGLDLISYSHESLDENSKALIIWGGGDIHPSLYNRSNVKTFCLEKPSQRDEAEWNHIQQAIKLGIPIIGVCRGAQMLCAAAGGILIQHLDGHAGNSHLIKTKEGQVHTCISIHHQAMWPWSVEHDLYAWTHPARLSDVYLGVNTSDWKAAPSIDQIEHGYIEPEIVYFPTIKGLAIQSHPEMMHPNCSFNVYIKNLCKTLYV